jgi:hypothetical protein
MMIEAKRLTPGQRRTLQRYLDGSALRWCVEEVTMGMHEDCVRLPDLLAGYLALEAENAALRAQGGQGFAALHPGLVTVSVEEYEVLRAAAEKMKEQSDGEAK